MNRLAKPSLHCEIMFEMECMSWIFTTELDPEPPILVQTWSMGQVYQLTRV